MPRKFTAIPQPIDEKTSLNAVKALKQGYEVLTLQTRDHANAAVTWQDLVDLGLIAANQIP